MATARRLLAFNILLEGLAEIRLPLLDLFLVVRALRTVRIAVSAYRRLISKCRSLKHLDIVLRKDTANDTVAQVCAIELPSRLPNDFIHIEWALCNPRCLYKPIFELFIVSILQIVPVIVSILIAALRHVAIVFLLHGDLEDFHLGVPLILDAPLIHDLVLSLEVDPFRRLINLLVVRRVSIIILIRP